jgi:porphobilinogen deaminase
MKGIVAHPDGSSLYSDTIAGAVMDAAELGKELAQRLLRNGADKILAVTKP